MDTEVDKKVLPKFSKFQNRKKRIEKTKNIKEARLIVRNLPFKITEDGLKDHFAAYGNVSEVNLLKKGSKMVGCAFIQFDSKWNAAKAIAKTSGKPFLGRVIVVDWAVSKTKYKSQVTKKEGVKVKLESEDEESSEGVKDIKQEETEDDDPEQFSENSDSSDEECKVKEEEIGKLDSKNEKRTPKKKKLQSNTSVNTVFLRNIPFSATNDDLKSCTQSFGEVEYALICIDRMTEHSKGTGFVKFKEKSGADACLNAGDELNLNGVVLEAHIAVPREQLQLQQGDTEKKPKDNRNLYLAREGVILPGSEAALGVSNADMSKRLEVENWKAQKLKDLNMFISQTRLTVHNIPAHINDKKLTQIVKNLIPKSTPCEVKIIRDLQNVDENGVGKSKGYAFIGCNTHEQALTTLRALNNNPTVFTQSKRPIVSFAIENRRILKVKEARGTKKKNQVANCNRKNFENEAKVDISNQDSISKVEDKKQVEKYEGLNANFGSKKLFTKYQLKKQAQNHAAEVKKLKLKAKLKKSKTRKTRKIKKEEAVPFSKINKKEEDNVFSKLVEKYKVKISNDVNKKKWYE